MIDVEYLELLKCPNCAPLGGGLLSLENEHWLHCGECQRNYPVVQDIPVMLPEEGDKWQGVAVADLPEISSHDRFVSAAS
jgi:uncharacterized protein